jgi:hypothetical protein
MYLRFTYTRQSSIGTHTITNLGESFNLFWHKYLLSAKGFASSIFPPPYQGDQIGRIFAHWAVIYFGQFF